MMEIRLPNASGEIRRYTPQPAVQWQRPSKPLSSRRAYAAAHVVPDVLGDNVPGAPAQLDWESTLSFRHEIWSYGMGVADAMDTAQRGMGLDWNASSELIQRSAQEANAVLASGSPALAGKSLRDLLACGAGTDQLDLVDIKPGRVGLDEIVRAYLEQMSVVSGAGAKTILMCSRALAAVADSRDDYLKVYSRLLEEADHPVILHWLGPMFDPALEGYWGSSNIDEATESFLLLINTYRDKVDGIKVSLLNADHEKRLRMAVPAGVRLYTGDDFNYPELIDSDGTHHSDALLGIFASIYPAASAALQNYDRGDSARGRKILDQTRDLGLHLFSAPTVYYKTGVAFLAWLNGLQPGFQMVGGLHSGRSVIHLARVFELADRAGVLLNPELAVRRMKSYLRTCGVEA